MFHVLFSPSPFAREFWLVEKSDLFHKSAYKITERHLMMDLAIKKYIPGSANISLSVQNDINCSFLSHHNYFWSFPIGVTLFVKNDKDEKIEADYVILDTMRRKIIVDFEDKEKFDRIVTELKDTWIKVFSYDGFFIFKNPNAENP